MDPLSVRRPPDLRRFAFIEAYSEGWGLYTERLADEMGLYSSEEQRLGMLGLDGMRAGRLVVDTGLHAFGWTRQQAVDYLRAVKPRLAVPIHEAVASDAGVGIYYTRLTEMAPDGTEFRVLPREDAVEV